MLKYSLSLMPILFLVGLLQADELEKSEVNKVYVMKDKTIIFELKDDSYLKGNVLTSDCLRGKIYFENKKMIRNSYRIENSSGFKTCRFSKLERVFTSEGVKLASK